MTDRPRISTERPDRARLDAFRIDPASAALLVVDLQHGSIDVELGYSNIFRYLGNERLLEVRNAHIHGTTIPNVQRLQAGFRAAGAPVIFLTVGSAVGDLSDMPPRFRRAAAYCAEHGLPAPWSRPGTREMTILEQIAPRPGEPVLVKTGASGFTGSPLERVLGNRGIRVLVLCGVSTTYCVESTLRDGADRGYDCVLVEDACADMTAEFHRRGIESCRYFARVESTSTVVGELAASVRQVG